MHGVVNRLKPDSCAQRGLFEAAQFIKHLRTRSRPYGDLYSAMGGKGDALTIDDATLAGCEAAKLARKHGHQVTLFINPGHIATRKPYAHILLSLMVDRTKLPRIVFQGNSFELYTFENKRTFREQLKQHVLTIAGEAALQKFVQLMAHRLKVADLAVPRPLQTASLAMLRQLRDKGVTIGNHGWSHAALGPLSVDAAREDIVAGRNWIRQKLGNDANAYAVPYGRQLPPFRSRLEAYRVWLMDFNLLTPGFVGPQIYNRVGLSL